MEQSTVKERPYVLFAWAILLAGISAQVVMWYLGSFKLPYVMVGLGAIGVFFSFKAVQAKKTVGRWISLGLVGLVTLVMVPTFILRLPEYNGPIAVGKPLPEKFLKAAGMTSERPMSRVYVFFRGKW
jgi:hypothetical protein